MIDILRDGAEAWLQRIKSPLVGSILATFFAINWKPIFFVVFSDSPILFRFWYFDNQTTMLSLYFLPIALGLAIGLSIPYLAFFGSHAAKWPTEGHRMLQATSADKVMTGKAELAIKRELASAEFKEAALKDAQADQAIAEANLNPENRAELENRIKVEQDRTIERPATDSIELSELQKCVLLRLADAGGINLNPSEVWQNVRKYSSKVDLFYDNFENERLKVDVTEALVFMSARKLIEEVYNARGPDGIRLTSKGYREVDRFRPIPSTSKPE